MVGRIWKAKTKPSAAVPLASPAFTGSWPPPWMPERAEHELGAHEREVQEAGDPGADPGEEVLPDRDLEHEEREGELQAEAPEDRSGAVMALRFVDRAQAIPRNTSRPRSERSRSMCSPSLLRAREDVEDERAPGRGLGGDDDGLAQSRQGRLAAGGLPDVHGHDGLADRDRVAHLLVEDEADRGVDRAVDRLAARARGASRRARSPGRRGAPRARRARSAPRPSPRPGAGATGSSQTRGLPPWSSITRRKRSRPAPLASASRTRARAASSEAAAPAEVHHPGRELDGERLEVRGPAALEGLDALGHLEGVARPCARAAGPCR